MIKLLFGNVGSGKTAFAVRYMKNNPHKEFITNINIYGKGFKHVTKLTADMILTKEVVGHKRDGNEVTKLKLNVDFWKKLIEKKKHINVIIDEAHIFFNPRRSMSKLNIIMTDFLALLRRILGSSDSSGELILITQLSRRLDIIAREMATDVSYYIHHYTNQCKKCKLKWEETNETPNKYQFCPRCNDYHYDKIKSIIEVFDFKDVDSFVNYKEYKLKSYYRRYIILDIATIFGNYDTYQFEDMFSEY
jgi:hypothetical protein